MAPIKGNAITLENPISMYSSVFNDSVQIVSLEKAAALIEEERNRDESEYIEGGVDIGRTGRVFICEDCPENASRLESFPQVKLCGVEKILDRGLKYMSTGEIRRILLTKALLSGKQLLILSDPFAGLDVESRGILLDFFDTISKKSISEEKIETTFPRIILSMERFVEIPEAITNVLEFTDGNITHFSFKTRWQGHNTSGYTQTSYTKDDIEEQKQLPIDVYPLYWTKPVEGVFLCVTVMNLKLNALNFIEKAFGQKHRKVLKKLVFETK